jgi:hypothetical protein
MPSWIMIVTVPALMANTDIPIQDGADAVKPVVDSDANHVGDLAAKKSVRQQVSGCPKARPAS